MKLLCENCKKEFLLSAPGTKNRNHCPFCLYSKHVDIADGDRRAECKGLMKPIGLTFKHEGFDKYGKEKAGELMLVHLCSSCGKISINRIAGDDNPQNILVVFEHSLDLSESDKKTLAEKGIDLLDKQDCEELKIQLFGKIF